MPPWRIPTSRPCDGARPAASPNRNRRLAGNALRQRLICGSCRPLLSLDRGAMLRYLRLSD
ncbi:hypothetical protein J7I44_07215 [Frateuria sp. MAH-13]|uniref:Uncharacterized protein n=1 Tax=Frateuria flava TaxID=2821489 RepID=A0ABS4DM03_9GAMM|nr:hypothetical protein [Frateuria flava]